MLYCLGDLVFKTSDLPIQDMQRQTAWRHAKADRTGARPAYQSLGEDEDTISFAGTIVPEFGNQDALTELRTMAKSGQAYMLANGRGDIFGMFAVTSMNETGTNFKRDGVPRKIAFTLSLLRVDDDLTTDTQPSSTTGKQAKA